MTDSSELSFPRSDWVTELVRRSLAEDLGSGDATTAVAVDPAARAEGRVVARQAGVVAGLPLLEILFGMLGDDLELAPQVTDGSAVAEGDLVALLCGPAAPLLSGERTALNFLQHLSGIATLTARYVAAVAGTGCRILDTRKTVPGFRDLAKYAVRAGGGWNHRLGLYDRILLKDNHWLAARSDRAGLVERARRDFPGLAVEVEVDDLGQLAQVLPLRVDWVLLDNFTPEQVSAAVALRDRTPQGSETLLEASGNIDLANVCRYAEAGVDAVSVGRLTHSAPVLDLSLEIELLSPNERDAAP